jgi:hypothetical protein
MSENAAALTNPTLLIAPAPFEIEDVRVSSVGVGARQCKSLVPPTPRFDVR